MFELELRVGLQFEFERQLECCGDVEIRSCGVVEVWSCGDDRVDRVLLRL